jgi:hypothetical protein
VVGLRWFRALLVAACLALVWWAVWLLDPRTLAGPVAVAAVLAGQAADLFAVLGFWHTVWPRRPRDLPWGPAAGRAAVVREALLRAEDALDVAPCLGDGCVLRRGALRSIGGLLAAGLSQSGALWLAPALRAHGWRARPVGEPLLESRGRSRLTDLARSWRTAAAELRFALRPGPQASGEARLHTAWVGLRHLALPGLLLSTAGVAASAGLGMASPVWVASLAVHLLPYLVLRLAVPVLLPEPRPPERVPVPPAVRPRGARRRPSERVPPELGWNVSPDAGAAPGRPRGRPAADPGPRPNGRWRPTRGRADAA